MAGLLRQFADARIFPALIDHRGSELEVEYVDGEISADVASTRIDAIADFFSVLYTASARRVVQEEWRFRRRIQRRLRLLVQAGILDSDSHARLADLAERSAPDEVWLGCDYTDFLPQNVVWTANGALRAVDVESLSADRLLGTGLAKACQFWLGAERARLLHALAERGAPDLRADWSFIELHFHCARAKRQLARGRVPDLSGFDALLGREAG